METDKNKYEIATFANGCFWCTEAVFQRLRGVIKVQNGYAGGHVDHPTYQQVCTGETGHAECLQITFSPDEITYNELLEVFWKTHDPTSLNRQGNDVGTQYRSAIFYHNDKQKELAITAKEALDQSDIFDKPVVTEIVPYSVFFPAEKEHDNYYNRHPLQPYCYFVTRPKVEKLKKLFADKLKAN